MSGASRAADRGKSSRLDYFFPLHERRNPKDEHRSRDSERRVVSPKESLLALAGGGVHVSNRALTALSRPRPEPKGERTRHKASGTVHLVIHYRGFTK